MPIRILLILHLTLVALVALNTIYVFNWSTRTDGILLGGMAITLVVMWVAVRRAASRRRATLACLRVLGALALLAAAGSLAAPAWLVLGADASDAGVSAAGRMAPMFLTALALYGTNLWLDAAQAVDERQKLERLARLLSGPRLLPALITALLLTAGMLLAMDWSARGIEESRVITQRFLDRGIIPPLTVLLFFWGLLLLLGKQWNTWFLRSALRHWSSGNRRRATAPLVASIDSVAAGATALEESIALLWQRYEESYLFPRYISWAVPVLGFIGTVLGISLAADGIRRIIGSDSGLSGLSSDLSGAIAPLGIAFDTTLIALSLSVALMLLLSLVQRSEERVLAMLEWEVRGSSRTR